MEPRNPQYAEKVKQVFGRAPFVRQLGIQVDALEPGLLRGSLAVQPWHLQQNGFLHAGVLATLADHSAGGAAATLVAADQGVLSIEFKVNFLRAAGGSRVECVSKVLKAGRSVSVAESEIFASENGHPILVAKATVTLAVVPDTTIPAPTET
jgi:uncharacterized protein (TIGR00369 family)